MMLLEGLTNSHENGPQTTCVHLGLRGAQNNAGFTSGHYKKTQGLLRFGQKVFGKINKSAIYRTTLVCPNY